MAANTSYSDEGQAEWQAWIDCIAASREHREPFETMWADLKAAYAGSTFKRAMFARGDNRGADIWNKAADYVNAITPQIVQGEPECAVEPMRSGEEYRLSAQHREYRVNGFVRQLRLRRVFEKAFRSSCWSVPILQVGINIKSNLHAVMPGSDNSKAPVHVDLDRERADRHEYHDAGYPYIAWVDPFRFYPDFSTSELEQMYWCALEYYRTEQDMKADPWFSQYADKLQYGLDVKPREGESTGRSEYGSENQQRLGRDPRRRWVRLYDIYCPSEWVEGAERPGAIITIADDQGGCREILKRVPLNLGFEGFPFIMGKFLPIDGEVYPIPLLCQWDETAKEVNAFYAAMVDGASQQKNGIAVGNMDAGKVEEIRKMLQNGVIGIDPNSFKAFTIGGMAPEVPQVASKLEELCDKASGIGDMYRGVAMGGRTTATEASKIEQHAATRVDGIREAYFDVLSQAFRMLDAIVDQNLDSLHGTDLRLDEYRYVIIDADNPMPGETNDFLFSVQVGSNQRVDPAIRQRRSQDLLQMIPGIQQVLAMEGQTIRMTPILEDYIRSLGYVNVQRIIQPMQEGVPGVQDDPAAALIQIKVQREDQQMMSGIAVPVDPKDHHETEAALHMQELQMLVQQGMVNEETPFVDLMLRHIGEHKAMAMQTKPTSYQERPQAAMMGAGMGMPGMGMGMGMPMMGGADKDPMKGVMKEGYAA